jgi:hypothetical protein
MYVASPVGPQEETSMSEYQEPVLVQSAEAPRWVALSVAIIAVLSLIGLGVGWSAISHANNVEQSTQAFVKQTNDSLGQRLAKAEEQNQQFQSDLKVVTNKLKVTQTELIAARKQTKSATVAYEKKLNGLQSSVSTELATKASADDFNRLNGDVTGVKGDLDATKNSIQMARSEMGTLIARNHDEIDQLRRMGQRDYFEFALTRKSGPQKVGGIQVQLKSTNVKKNRYTVDVLADDKSFEKKDRSVNEPIFFYTGGSRAALELVINKVTKTGATGYLSLPKSGATSASTAASAS